MEMIEQINDLIDRGCQIRNFDFDATTQSLNVTLFNVNTEQIILLIVSGITIENLALIRQ